MLKIIQYGLVSKTLEDDLESGKVRVDSMVDFAKDNNLILVLRVTEKGFVVGSKELLSFSGIEELIKKGIKVDIETNYDILDGNPEDPRNLIISLAEYQARLREMHKDKIAGRAALRVTLGHNILGKREFNDDDYRLIKETTEAYDRVLKPFNAALAWENTYHSVDQIIRILDLTKHLERIGMTFDFGNSSARELHPERELASQEQIMGVASEYIGKVDRVHLKQIVNGYIQPLILDYVGSTFKINEVIRQLQDLGYGGYFCLEQHSKPNVKPYMNASLLYLTR